MLKSASPEQSQIARPVSARQNTPNPEWNNRTEDFLEADVWGLSSKLLDSDRRGTEIPLSTCAAMLWQSVLFRESDCA